MKKETFKEFFRYSQDTTSNSSNNSDSKSGTDESGDGIFGCGAQRSGRISNKQGGKG